MSIDHLENHLTAQADAFLRDLRKAVETLDRVPKQLLDRRGQDFESVAGEVADARHYAARLRALCASVVSP